MTTEVSPPLQRRIRHAQKRFMRRYEYKVIAAPTRGQKAPGVKAPEARFAHALEGVMNDLAVDGWEYLRADTLPSEERQGLTGSATHFRNVLIFRRKLSVGKREDAVGNQEASTTPARPATDAKPDTIETNVEAQADTTPPRGPFSENEMTRPPQT